MSPLTYADILNRERPTHAGDPFSYRHPSMPIGQRAKLFAPFAALSGFDDEVRRKEVHYEPRRVPDAEELRELNRRLCLLRGLTFNRQAVRTNRPVVCAEYFVLCEDPHHDGCGTLGRYVTAKGLVTRVDPEEQLLWVDGTAIPFGDLYDISDPEGRLFGQRTEK